MAIAVSLLLFALGAVLTFATDVSVSALDLDVVGVVLMLVGIIGFVLTLVVWRPRRRLVRTAPPADVVVERRGPTRRVVEERRGAPRREVVKERRVYDDPTL
jgi:hypothetical protein